MNASFQPTRVCPYCAELIPSAARVCPRCRQWLTLRSFRNPVVLTLTHVVPLMLLWFVGGMVTFRQLERLGNPKPYYSDVPHALKITESRMNWVNAKDGQRIYVTGILTNSSSLDWKTVEFDCRFFDREGKLIDASNGHGFLTASALEETAFRVAVEPTAPTNDYASFQISVSTARNAMAAY